MRVEPPITGYDKAAFAVPLREAASAAVRDGAVGVGEAEARAADRGPARVAEPGLRAGEPDPQAEAQRHRVQLRLHEASGRVQIQVVDRWTGEVLDAIPPDQILDLVADLHRLAAAAFDRKA